MATHYFASHRGGVEIVAGELFRGFAQSGQEITWMAGDVTPPPEPVGNSRTVGVRIYNFVETTIGLPFPIPKLGAIKKISLEVRHIDLLILHDCLYLTNILAFLIAAYRRVPIIIVQHIGFIRYKNLALGALMRLATAVVTRPLLSRADQVIFISEKTRNFFCTVNFRCPPKVVYNGVNTDIYHPLAPGESKDDLRSAYQLPTKCPVILFVGRFVEKKGISVLNAMATMRPDYIWVFAGWGPLDPEKWNMRNVRVFRDLVGEALAGLYRVCDVFVLPSTGEGFPLVIQEALASGLRIICGSETLAADGRLSEFAQGAHIYAGDDEHTAEDFIEQIDRVLNSPVPPTHASQAHLFAASQYSWQRAAEQYIEVAGQIIDASSGHRLTAGARKVS